MFIESGPHQRIIYAIPSVYHEFKVSIITVPGTYKFEFEIRATNLEITNVYLVNFEITLKFLFEEIMLRLFFERFTFICKKRD